MYHSNEILNTIGFSEIDKPSSYQKGNNTVTENNDNHIIYMDILLCGVEQIGIIILFKTPNLFT